MPLTLEQQALRKAAQDLGKSKWLSSNDYAVARERFDELATHGIVLNLLAKHEALTAEHAHAIDSVAQLQDEVLALQAKLAALDSPADPLQVLVDQAQALDMGYGNGACAKCGASPVVQEEPTEEQQDQLSRLTHTAWAFGLHADHQGFEKFKADIAYGDFFQAGKGQP